MDSRFLLDYEGRNFSDYKRLYDYLIALFDYSTDFSWQAATASHAVLLYRIGQSEVTSWSQANKIDRIRRAEAHQHVIPTHTTSGSQKFRKKSGISKICQVNALCQL